MRFLKIFDRILKSRLKIFYFSVERKQEIEQSFSILDGDSSDSSLTTFYYSNILNIMTSRTYLGSYGKLRIGVQDLLHDRRIIRSLYYELILWTYSRRFFREIFFPKIQLCGSSSGFKSIIRASQSGYLFINPENFYY